MINYLNNKEAAQKLLSDKLEIKKIDKRRTKILNRRLDRLCIALKESISTEIIGKWFLEKGEDYYYNNIIYITDIKDGYVFYCQWIIDTFNEEIIGYNNYLKTTLYEIIEHHEYKDAPKKDINIVKKWLEKKGSRLTEDLKKILLEL